MGLKGTGFRSSCELGPSGPEIETFPTRIERSGVRYSVAMQDRTLYLCAIAGEQVTRELPPGSSLRGDSDPPSFADFRACLLRFADSEAAYP